MGAQKKRDNNGDNDNDHGEELMKTLLFITKYWVNLKKVEWQNNIDQIKI